MFAKTQKALLEEVIQACQFLPMESDKRLNFVQIESHIEQVKTAADVQIEHWDHHERCEAAICGVRAIEVVHERRNGWD